MGWFSVSLSSALNFFKKIFGSSEGKDFLIGIASISLDVSRDKVEALWDTLETLCQQAYLNFPASGTGQAKYDWVISQLSMIGEKAKPFVIDFIMHQVLAFLAKKGAKV